jgi:hypothetical protein
LWPELVAFGVESHLNCDRRLIPAKSGQTDIEPASAAEHSAEILGIRGRTRGHNLRDLRRV